MKLAKVLFIFLGVLLLSLFLSPKTHAATFKTGENVTIAKNQTINDTLFTSGTEIIIDADVRGDVFCAGQKVQINGNVDGDVICAAQEIVVNGQVSGNIRAAAETIVVTGSVARNVMVAAQKVTARSNIEREMFVAAETLNMQGTIVKKLYGGVEKANITGEVGQDVNLEVDQLTVGDKARIGGDLNYKSQNQATIANSNAVTGEINYEKRAQEKDENTAFTPEWFSGKILSILSALAIAMLMVLLWPRNIERINDVLKNNLWGSLGFGVLFMFLVPVIALFLLFTIIGIPIGILLFVLWGVALYLSRIFVGIFIGKKLLESFWKSKKDSIVWSSVVGVVVTWIAFATPFIGGLLSLIAMWIGLGAIFYLLKPSREAKVKTTKKK